MNCKIYPALVFLFAFVIACSGSNDNTGIDPGFEPPEVKAENLFQIPGTDKRIGGLWKFSVSEDHQEIEVTPIRSADFHLNVTTFLEITPCSDCVTVLASFIPAPDELLLYVRIINPFTEGKYTVFDTRGIFISGSDWSFPETGREISWDGTYPRFLNTDGYTNLYNPVEFPEDSPVLNIYKYISGNFASDSGLTATLNPFKYFYTRIQSERYYIGAGGRAKQWLHLKAPEGSFSFGYAIDASFVFTDGDIKYPWNQISDDADIREARWIDVITGSSMGEDVGSESHVQVKVTDLQGLDTIDEVLVECPELFSGTVSLTYDGPIDDSHYFSGRIYNELGAEAGTYPLLIKVIDTEDDPALGENAAWDVEPIHVSDNWVRHWGIDMRNTFYNTFSESVDDEGNTYIVCKFDGDADLDPDSTTDNFTQDEYGYHVVKFNNAGEFEWATKWVQPANTCFSSTDSEGNLYIGLTEKGEVDFDPGPGFDFQGSDDTTNAFLTKFSTDGTYLWTRAWLDATLTGLVTHADNSVRISGGLWGPVDMDPGTGELLLEPSASASGYICHLDSQGAFLDAIPWASGGYEFDIDHSGNIIICGFFSTTRDFDPDPVNERLLDPLTDADLYFASLTSDLQLNWVRNMENGIEHFAHAWNHPTGIETDSSGAIYISGAWFGTVDFDTGPGEDIRTANSMEYYPSPEIMDPFLIKYSSDGEFLWAYTKGSDNYDVFESVDLDFAGNILVSGATRLPVYPTEYSVINYGGTASYLGLFDPGGSIIWEQTWGGNSALRNAQYDSSGNIYIQGWFDGWADFDPGNGVIILNPLEHYDYFIQRLNSDGSF